MALLVMNILTCEKAGLVYSEGVADDVHKIAGVPPAVKHFPSGNGQKFHILPPSSSFFYSIADFWEKGKWKNCPGITQPRGSLPELQTAPLLCWVIAQERAALCRRGGEHSLPA